jgi:hypothetical protein
MPPILPALARRSYDTVVAPFRVLLLGRLLLSLRRRPRTAERYAAPHPESVAPQLDATRYSICSRYAQTRRSFGRGEGASFAIRNRPVCSGTATYA